MTRLVPFSPQAVYGGNASDPDRLPRVLIAPHRYIQGQGVLDNIGKYLSVLPSAHPAVLLSKGGHERFGNRLLKSFDIAGVRESFEIFRGECSQREIDRLTGLFSEKQPSPVDALIAIGGGKCIDTGKCVANRLNVPVVSCPTIASTDAPCSAVSVVYSDEGVQIGPEHFPSSPALVVVDTGVIIEAPIRQLVAGMGDALATYYEARTCFRNPKARSVLGARPTITALAIAELCARTVFENGQAAMEAVERKQINEAFERIVEANTLLSGVGFESGGLAATHAIAAGLTVIPALHSDYLHGELVGIGILAHLLLEDQPDEARRVGEFMATVGLPVHAGQLGLDMVQDSPGIMAAMENAVASHLTDSEPFEVTPQRLFEAFSDGNQLGLEIAGSMDDLAFRKLRTPFRG